jgi:hypothetical protein
MKNSVSVRTSLSLILVILCLIWWIATSVMYAYIDVIISKPAVFDGVLGYGLLFSLCAHVVLLYTTLPDAGKFTALRNGSLFLGTLSFASLFYDWLSLNEMGNEYEAGYPWSSMVNMLWTMQAFHLLYYGVALVYFLRLRKLSQTAQAAVGINGQDSYNTLNVVGTAVGLIGTLPLLLFMYMAHRMNQIYNLHAVYVFASGYFLLPYVLVWVSWLVKLCRNPSDTALMFRLYKAAAVTLAFTLLLILALFVASLINSPVNRNLSFTDTNINLLWLPLMLYAGLLVFSVEGIIIGRRRSKLYK